MGYASDFHVIRMDSNVVPGEAYLPWHLRSMLIGDIKRHFFSPYTFSSHSSFPTRKTRGGAGEKRTLLPEDRLREPDRRKQSAEF